MTYGLPARLAELTTVPVSSGSENDGALLPSVSLALDAAGSALALDAAFATADLVLAFLVADAGALAVAAFLAGFTGEPALGELGFVVLFLAAIKSSIATYPGCRFRALDAITAPRSTALA